MKRRVSGHRYRRLLCFYVLSTLFLPLLSLVPSTAQIAHDDLTGVKVAIYNGLGPMASSRIALTNMFEWMNATVVDITASQVLDDFFDDCDIVVFPGGSESSYSSELGSEGKQKIKDFVAQGGSYFGICGGSTFGVIYLRLFDGYITPLGEPGSIIHATTMHVNQSSVGPQLSDLASNFTTMYYASQYFVPKLGASFHPIATYDYNDQPGMIACNYRNGTVFLSSPHPEYEEDNDRDGTTFGDELEDPESEWDLLLRVSTWLIDESPYAPPITTTTTTTSTTTNIATTSSITATIDILLITATLTGCVIVMLMVIFLYRRMH
ncbi:hypothetical protein EU527_12990 [Candidatus Thorarchaeota archaeon]|nr:MAG: hypothetical protein EU527_12990 [Candidatus Thorarchaeota archaeon]